MEAPATLLANLLGVPCGPAGEGLFFAVYVNATLCWALQVGKED